jgi:predicted enzyme related to lactoylglutathione lyase
VSLPERWFRREPDSSGLVAPRLLARVALHPDELDQRIAFYEGVLGVPCDARMPLPEAGLELATVGNLLLIGNPNPVGETARATAYTLLVASVPDYLTGLQGSGTDVTEPVTTSVAGRRARVRFPDGTLVEVIDHRPRPEELGPGAPTAGVA